MSSVMDDVIRQTVADLLALCKDADRNDAERIQKIIELLQSDDAHDEYAIRWHAKLPH